MRAMLREVGPTYDDTGDADTTPGNDTGAGYGYTHGYGPVTTEQELASFNNSEQIVAPIGPDHPEMGRSEGPDRRSAMLVFTTLGMFTFMALFLWNLHTQTSPNLDIPTQTTDMFVKTTEKIDIDATRAAIKDFVDSVRGQKFCLDKMYYPDASLQEEQWEICTIVQQCDNPHYMIPTGNLTAASRGKLFAALETFFSSGGYKQLMLQQLANNILGQYQTHAVQCEGQCLVSEDPLTNANLMYADSDENITTFEECANVHRELLKTKPSKLIVKLDLFVDP